MYEIHVVLHRPIYPRNTGMCCRAIANMDAKRLILVAPGFELDHEEAKQGAAHAQEVLRDTTVYKSNEDFLANEGDGLRIALSGKDGRLKNPEFLDVTLDRLALNQSRPPAESDTDSPKQQPLYLIFGPEDDGLSLQDMALCHHVCRLPTLGTITSLNLSHAVLLTLYMVQSSLRNVRLTPSSIEDRTGPRPIRTPAIKTPSPAYYPSQSIHRWLETLGFDLSARRVSIEKILNHIFLSNSPSSDDLRILDSVLHQTIRKLEAKKTKE
jgi:tRNA/rRNA methyltransferase